LAGEEKSGDEPDACGLGRTKLLEKRLDMRSSMLRCGALSRIKIKGKPGWTL